MRLLLDTHTAIWALAGDRALSTRARDLLVSGGHEVLLSAVVSLEIAVKSAIGKLDLPGSLPAMFTGFRISAGLSVVGAIVGEFFFKSGAKGIGTRIQLYTLNSYTDKLIAAIALTAVMGIVIFLFFGWLGNRVTESWRSDAAARP